LKLKYYNLTDNYKSSENNLRAEGDFSSYYEKQLVHIPILVDYYANKFDTVKNNSTIVALNPYINSSGDKWSARIGMNIAIVVVNLVMGLIAIALMARTLSFKRLRHASQAEEQPA